MFQPLLRLKKYIGILLFLVSIFGYTNKIFAQASNDTTNIASKLFFDRYQYYIQPDIVFDPVANLYYIYYQRNPTLLLEGNTIPDLILSPKEYSKWEMQRSLHEYWTRLNSKTENSEIGSPVSALLPLNLNFKLGKLDRIFGPGGLKLQTRGTLQIKMGILSNKTDNPALSIGSRRKTYFDFDQNIQATVTASLGNRLKFNLNYNTNATFDFDSKNLKLAYEGNEDDIIQSIEAGNISMTTGSTLIRGSNTLFGIKAALQFGRLKATTIVSQQNSEARSVNSKRGIQTTEFNIPVNEYDQNRHFFLAQWFYDHYDNFASTLPIVSSGIKISRIEVWITNRNSNFEQSRNIVAFQDLGESKTLGCSYWIPDISIPWPSNRSNNLLDIIKNQYPDARNIAQVTQALGALGTHGIQGGIDYEKVESARLLDASEYILNPTLGYISLKTALTSDEVLAVAFEYSYNGQIYQVGEFSSDIPETSKTLFVKMLRATTVSPQFPMWKLMMKNVYSLGAYQMQSSNFKLQIKYLSDTTGTQILYIPETPVSQVTLLQLMGLDRLDSNQLTNPDGFFDYIEGYTVLSSMGKIIFPVVEPFGKNLEIKLSGVSRKDKYLYKELYDSSYVVASQFSDKNKYYLTGEYLGSSGSQIRLNAVNVPRGSVRVTAGATVLQENVDYIVDYTLGIVTITNQSIIDSGQNISVSLENMSMFSTQRKTLLGLDLQYQLSRDLNFGATVMHYSEKALTEKVSIGDEIVNNTMWGVNLSYNKRFMWLTNLLNKIPTVNATTPSSISLQAEFAHLIPHSQSGSSQGSSYIDDFEDSQVGIDLRYPYAWQLASTPYEGGSNPLFPEAGLSNNLDYGKNRALLAWNYIDRIFTDRNSSYCPGYIKSDLKQLSNPYVREVTSQEIFPGRELGYGESSLIQTLNLSFYPSERGPYNVDATNIDENFNLLHPEKRWGGIMRKMETTNFQQSNIEYIQFWLMSPFLDNDNPNYEGGDLYFNLGDISEDILKDGLKSYENGIPADGSITHLTETVWGRVSNETSLTYSFDGEIQSRLMQDVGLDGLPNSLEYEFPSYANYLDQLKNKLSSSKIGELEKDPSSPFNDPAGDNYHFFRGYDYDEMRLSILERYKHYNGVEGNSLDATLTGEPLYQSSRNTPDVEDINQDNTLNEYERYFQYRISVRPEDFIVGQNYITDKQTSIVRTRDGENQEVEWYQFKIPLNEFQKRIGNIVDFTSIRFMRIFLTGFKNPVHLRFGTLELVRGEWRTYDYNLNVKNDKSTSGELDISVVNIEENASRKPVNYVLPPGVTRVVDPSQSQITQLNEQSLSLTVKELPVDESLAIYRNTSLDLRNYGKLQMWIHAEALIDNYTNLIDKELSLIIRIGSDARNNFYQYEIPLTLTAPGSYNNNMMSDREMVWPASNYMDIELQDFVKLKQERNHLINANRGVAYNNLFTISDTGSDRTMGIMGNPSLSDIRVIVIGIKNVSNSVKSGTVWINELKVTNFNESGGWAFKSNVNIGLSDIATLNIGYEKQTSGFGMIDQSLNQRNMDDFRQISLALQVDAGRFMPAKLKLKAPIYYSYSDEKITPKYNPLDQDVLLKDALDAVETHNQRDSILSYAIDRSNTSAFSLSSMKFDVKNDTPKPWDPANFTINFSYNKQSNVNPNTEYENIRTYRGSLAYDYSPRPLALKPFSKISNPNKNLNFIRDWEFFYVPTNISFLTTISRYYYELQARSAIEDNFRLPLSVSKNFIWDRQLNLSWNLTRQLSIDFTSNTSARIEETTGAVNRKLFPDEYKQWKDTVWRSILHLGTPWAYNQTFNINYRALFNRIPILDFLTASVSYNSVYMWDRGTTIDNINTGNTVASQGTWNVEGRINFDNFYNKISYLKKVNQRFSSTNRNSSRKPRIVERTYSVRPDSVFRVRHNLRSKKLKVTGSTSDNKDIRVQYTPIDNNNIDVWVKKLPGMGDVEFPLKIKVTEIRSVDRSFWGNVADYSTRAVMSIRSIGIRWRQNHSLNLPLFANDIGDWFGQSLGYGSMSPGIGFAFGFFDDGFIDYAKEKGWLLTDNGQTSPAIWSNSKETNIELGLEPIKGLKIILTTNHTRNITNQIQFMYNENPVIYGGSFVKTHWALSSALRKSSASSGYESKSFNKFLEYIPIITRRVEDQYSGLTYPKSGNIGDTPFAGQLFNPENGTLSETSPDILIPAFIAAYSGYRPENVYLTPFPSLAFALPNWRVTYEGLTSIGNLSTYFKNFSIIHAYQCSYTIGSYTSYLGWQSAGSSNRDLGFIINQETLHPQPTSPYNISSVAINERFAPLIGISMTMQNNITVNTEWREERTLTLNTSAGQVVEASASGLTFGIGYKIIAFNTFLKIKNHQTGISNDLTINAEFSLQNSKALIRRIENAYTQPTNGARNYNFAISANYILSRSLTIGAYFDHRVNVPLVTNYSYPTSSTAFGILLNLSLAR